jgi:hypothetical protein
MLLMRWLKQAKDYSSILSSPFLNPRLARQKHKGCKSGLLRNGIAHRRQYETGRHADQEADG